MCVGKRVDDFLLKKTQLFIIPNSKYRGMTNKMTVSEMWSESLLTLLQLS